jgi:transcriptional regulator with XRE-family HTH domain
MPGPRKPSQRDYAIALGARLRQLRRSQRLTQKQVAARVPMSAGNLSRIENGEQGPPADETIRQLAVVLKTEPSELLSLAGHSGQAGAEERLIDEIHALRREMHEGFTRLERQIRAQP